MLSTPEADAISSLLSLMDAIRSDVQAELPDSCSFMHVKALDFVERTSQPSMRDIAGSLKITSPGATMVVDKLVENGELDRHADSDDRRIVRLGITAKGKKTLASGMKIVTRKIGSRVSALTKAEQKQLAALLSKLIKYNQ